MKKLILLAAAILLSLGNLTAQEVKFSLDPKTELWGVSKGSTWLIKPKYDFYIDFSTQGFAIVGVGYLPSNEFLDDGNYLLGLVDKYGNEIVEPKYTLIGDFNQNRAIVAKGRIGDDGFYGYIDTQGNEIIKPKYTDAQPFDSKGHAIVAYAKMPNEQDYYKIDINGNLVIENNIKAYAHKNGATSAKGKEVNGKKQGEWKFYNEEGYLIAIENYNNEGVAEGSYERFFWFKYGYGVNTFNRELAQTGNLKNGKKDGLIVFYNPNNGKPTYSELWENGVFKKVKDIHDDNGNLISSTGTGTLTTYREDSKYRSSKMEYQNGHRAGIGVWYHPEKVNQVRQKVLYKYDADDVNGLRWEIMEVNDYSGNPLPKGTLKEGNGTWISYDDQDKPTTISTYQNGKKIKEESALANDIDKIYENIIPDKDDTNPYAETVISSSSYEVIKGRNELLEKKYTQAFQSFEIAANKGEHEAMLYLATMYYEGMGVTKDYKKAYEWTLKAKNEGNADAAFLLGIMYYYGNGVTQSYAEAYTWYNVAAAKGVADADCNIGLLFEHGEGVEKNMQSAFNHYKKAADNGSLTGAYATGLYYYYAYNGSGVEKNIPNALKYMLQAEPQFAQNPDYCNTLAYCFFENGDFDLAINALNHAVTVDPDYANGYDSMGEMYLKRGDKPKAIEYYKKAASMGLENAIKWCRDNNISY